jgi:cell division protein FtsB
MQDEELEPGKNAAAADPLPLRALDWTLSVWRPAASGLAVVLTLLLGWHVVSGKNGLTVWEQKRAEDRQLGKEIDDLQQENARLRGRVDRLKSDPDAIGLVARDKLHYAKPNEVIVALPPDKPAQAQSAGSGR